MESPDKGEHGLPLKDQRSNIEHGIIGWGRGDTRYIPREQQQNPWVAAEPEGFPDPSPPWRRPAPDDLFPSCLLCVLI